MDEQGRQENNFMQWKAGIDQTMEQLQQAVEANEWDSVNKLLVHRQQQLEVFFQSRAAQTKTQTPVLIRWLQQIKQLDEVMENQIRQQQHVVKQALGQVGKGRKAVDAYRSL